MEESYYDVPDSVEEEFDSFSSPDTSEYNQKRHYFEHVDSIYRRQLLIGKLQEIVDRKENLGPICQSCFPYLSAVCEQKYGDYQRSIRSYTLVTHSLKQSKFVPTAGIISSLCPDYNAEADALMSRIEVMNSQIMQCETQLKDCEEQLRIIHDERDAIHLNIDKCIADIDAVEQSVSCLEDDLQLSLSLLECASRELEILDARTLVAKPLYDLQSEHDWYAINGLRVRFLPSSRSNLNWAEINAGWSCLALLLITIRLRAGLPEVVDIVRPSSNDNVGDIVGVRIQIKPLRKRAVVIKSIFSLERVPGGGYRIKSSRDRFGNTMVEAEDCSLMLEGGHERKSEYRRALVMFAVVVVITASQLKPLNLQFGDAAASLLQAVKRGSDRELWGYDDDDIDEYYDVNADIDDAYEPYGDMEEKSNTNAKRGGKVEELVIDILAIMLELSKI